MFERLIKLSLHNSVFVHLLFILIVAAGARAAYKLPREQFPEVSLDQVEVRVGYQGATAQDVEELITKPIEDSLEDVADIDRIRSVSQEGAAGIYITFLEGTDLQTARSEVEKAVSTVEDLPEDAQTPIIKEMTLELPVVSVGLLGDPSATKVVDDLADALSDVQGVASVKISGVAERKIFVDIDEAKLRSLGLQPTAIAASIQRAHASVPAGSVELDGRDVFVKTQNRLESAREVAAIPLAPGSPLRIGDVAVVEDVGDPADSRFFVNGEPAVKLTVGREETADPLDIRDDVAALLETWRDRLPAGSRATIADDYTAPIRDRLNTLGINAIGGAVLVLLVLFVMSGMRQALLALIGMPVSFMAATFLMGQTGLSINVVSTFGLLIAIGIIVDDAVVVIENVQRHLEMGKSRVQATLDGTKEVLLPVTVAVLTTCLAFVPLTMVGGTMGRVMRILPMVVIFCLVGSLIEAILILPGHLSEYASKGAKGSRAHRQIEVLKRWYKPVLSWCVRHRYVTVLLVTAALGGVGFQASRMPFQFGAPAKPFELNVYYEVMPGLDRAYTKKQGEALNELVRGHLGDNVTSSTLRVGSIMYRDTGFVSHGANKGSLRWEFELDDETIAKYPAMVRDLRYSLATNPELGSNTVKEMSAGPPSGAAVTARLRGRDIDELNRAVADLKTALYGMKGVSDIRDDYGAGKETFRVRVDPDRAARLGLTELEIGQAVRSAVDGLVALEVSIDEEPVEIVVRYASGRSRTRDGLRDLLIPTTDGRLVRLDQVAEIDRTRELGFVRREDKLRSVSVLAEVDTDVITALGAAKRLEGFWDEELSRRYPDLTLSFGGEADELTRSLQDLPGAFALAVMMIYIVLALQFKSYIQPLIILAAVPFGLMGAVIGLNLMGYPLSLMALFGIIALAGIVVNDSLVMIDFINKKRDAGASTQEATIQGAMGRLRPILSTTLTTCLGLLPLAIGLGGRDDVLAPMALSISAGLGFATGLVLFVVPALYRIFEDIRSRFRRSP